MNTRLKIIGLILVVCSSLVSGCRPAAPQGEQGYTITVPHEYEITPGTKEWEQLTNEERIASCYVSAEEINQMTTEALIDTVIHYPYLLVVEAGSTVGAWKEGILILCEQYQFTGLSELLIRPDARECLEAYMAEKNPSSKEYLDAERIIYYLEHWNIEETP